MAASGDFIRQSKPVRPAPITLAHWAVGLACAAPLVWLIAQLFLGGLGANPVEKLTRELGQWGLRFLLLTLALGSVAALAKTPVLLRFRRTLGLFAFGAISLHLLSWVGLDHGFDLSALWKGIVKRPYITIGMAAFLALIPLAITSTNGMIRRIGPKRWKLLHRLTYGVVVAGIVHFYLLVKADHTEPLIYAAIAACLLGARFVPVLRARFAA